MCWPLVLYLEINLDLLCLSWQRFTKFAVLFKRSFPLLFFESSIPNVTKFHWSTWRYISLWNVRPIRRLWPIQRILLPFVSAGLDRWRAGSQNSVTQRFKKDIYIKYRNFLKVPNFDKDWVLFLGKKAILITLTLFLASFSLNFNWIFCTFALKFNKYHCQIHFPHEKTVQMSYWRSQLNNFEYFWPITTIFWFETWIISRLLKTIFAKMTYHWLLWSTNNNSQGKICFIYHKTQTCSKPTFLRPPSFVGDFYVKLRENLGGGCVNS